MTILYQNSEYTSIIKSPLRGHEFLEFPGAALPRRSEQLIVEASGMIPFWKIAFPNPIFMVTN